MKYNIYRITSYFFGKTIFLLALISFFFFLTCDVFILANDLYQAERPIAVIIGNSTDEMEIQRGLSKADIVYEMEVEFPFTRYMAIFLGDTETIVGPVRSSRYYFSRICAEWFAIFIHCGGQNLKNENVLDIDEIEYPALFWRDKNIGGWINLFTNTAKLRKETSKNNSLYDKQNSHYLVNYANLNETAKNQVRKISIKYHKDYIVSYEYKPDEQKYYRYVNQRPHKDYSNNEQIEVSNIIIQYTSIKEITGDDQGRVQIDLIGEGVGKVFSEGNIQSVKWLKKSKEDKTIFLDSNDNPLSYNPGTTWIHVLSSQAEVWVK